jgi:REP element-mobilizing transposase RayT
MARLARHRSAPGSLQSGSLYHVTNRGVDRMRIFDADADRILFLSILAHLCEQTGLVIHAFCLMDNHFHLLVEDPRGLLAQAMNLLQSVYARSFNASRSWRRTGHLFTDRYFSEVVDSRRYYDQLAAYILLNPLRTVVPLAVAVEAYPWSSARVSTSTVASAEFCEKLLARVGGIDSMIAALPRARLVEAEANRRARLEALARGTWLAADAVRCGMAPDQYRAYLASRRGLPRPEPDPRATHPREDVKQPAPEFTEPPVPESAAGAGATLTPLPTRGNRLVGIRLDDALEIVERECGRIVPALDSLTSLSESWADALCFALWRFTSARIEEIAAAKRLAVERVERALAECRSRCRIDEAWARVVWRLEWGLRWRLAAGPWRW